MTGPDEPKALAASGRPCWSEPPGVRCRDDSCESVDGHLEVPTSMGGRYELLWW